MENYKVLSKFFNYSITSSVFFFTKYGDDIVIHSTKHFLTFRLSVQHLGVIFPVRYYSSDLTSKRIQTSNIKKKEMEDLKENQLDPRFYKSSLLGDLILKDWNERKAVRIAKKRSKDIYNIRSAADLLRILQNMNRFPLTITEFIYFLKRKHQRDELVAQQYLPRRVAVLKPDLAAAHFLIARGGSVKFLGQPTWVGPKEKFNLLPHVYVPGIFVQCIKAEGTNLLYEGLNNLSDLNFLSSLSLKNLETVNDWFLDWISSEYSLTLKHLDISGCKNVTYRGLSCFYRFECLETLDVEGVSDSPEFKLACLLLLHYMPNLNIKGIDLDLPEKLEPLHVEEPKYMPKT